MDNANWMGELAPSLREISIFYLGIPGTHDSLSFSLKPNNDISPDSPKIAKILSALCGPLSKRIIYNWSVTQSENVEQQFISGVRYFDLRVATKKDKIYSCHGLYGMNIMDALININQLLEAHPTELVILDFQHFYDFLDTNHSFLTGQLQTIFKQKLCPKQVTSGVLSLNWLNKFGFQVIVIYRDEYADKYDCLWPSYRWLTLWPNTVDIDRLCYFLTASLTTRPIGAGFVSQCLYTPSSTYIVMHVFSTLRNKCCKECNRLVKQRWIQKQECRSQYGINVIIADFIADDGFDLCKTVINLNYEAVDDRKP